MSKNILQIFSTSAAVSFQATDLLYLGRSPYGPGDDFAFQYSTLAAQFVGTSAIIDGAHGGTGVANTGKTITLGGSLTTTGAFNPTLAFQAGNTYTFPSAGQTLLGLAGGTMTGDLFLNADPTSATQAATKSYVDSVASGFTVKNPCYAATTAALTATYNNVAVPPSGVGATLTNSGTQALFALDGVNPPLSSRVLVKNQAGANELENGIYTVTDVGSGATNWVLTRATDYDQPAEIKPGDLVIINHGNTLASTAWVQTDTVTSIGVDPIAFSQFGAAFPLSLANGGTGKALTASNGGIVYSDASTFEILAGTATANLPLLSGSSAAPSWGLFALNLGGILTTAGAVTFSGAHSFTGTLTADTNVTFPTSGTLATTAQIPSLPFIVGASGFYTTIQAAINAAALVATSTNHAVVLINGGSYTENLTLKSFVDLASFGGVSENAVIVVGNSVYTAANDNETISFSGITFKTPGGGGAAFTVNGAKICTVDINDCAFQATTGTGMVISNAGAVVTKTSCHLSASSGQKVVDMSAGTMTHLAGFSTMTDTASTLSGTASLTLIGTYTYNAFVLTGSASLNAINGLFIPLNNLSFVDIGASASANIFSSTVVSTAVSGFWATGTGALTYNAINTLTGTAVALNPTLSIANESLAVGNLSFDGGATKLTTNGQLIIGNTGGQPKIATLSAGSGISITNGAGSISIATSAPIPSLPLSLANGGTNADLSGQVSNGGIVWSNATQLQILAGTSTAKQMLQSGASATPAWSTATWPSTTTANALLYSSTTNVVGQITPAASSVLISSALDVPSWSQTLPSAVQGNITTVGTISSGTWQGGVIGGTYGGTGVNNGASTITIGGSVTFSGAFTFTGTLSNTTSVTFPTSGTLVNTAVTTLSSLASIGTITTGVWHGSVIAPTYGGTGVADPTAHGIMIAEGSSAMTPLVLTDGQLPIGKTGSDPTAATLTAGTNISITNGGGTITIAATGVGGFTWNDLAGTSQAAAVNNGYIISNASQTTVTLPSTAVVGSVIAVQGKGAAGWILAANSGQTIKFGSATTTTAGSLTSSNLYDAVEVVCITANTTWGVSRAVGNLTVA